MKEKITLIRYKKDLRITNHQPLYEACQWDFPVIWLYIREPHIMRSDDYSHFHQYWTQESIKDLKQSLKKLNIPLLMRYGEVKEALDDIRNYYDIQNIYAHEETGNHLTYMRDLATITYCRDHHISLREYPSNGVVRKLSSRDHRSIFQKDRMSQALIPIPKPQDIRTIDETLIQQSQESFKSFSAVSRPATWIYSRDQPGETSAQVRLQYFLTHASGYRYALSRPELSVKDSSRLSAYLTFGNLSMRQVHQATLDRIRSLKTQTNEEKSTKEVNSLVAFYQRLFWRCHFVQKLESRPRLESYNQNKVFDTIRAETNTEMIDARYHGQTGIPLIDAGMRCLHATGWINFRMRATLVSFICNTCMQPWQAIGPMLAKIFVDYEPGIHYSQLQMQSGTTGINTIRIYNPIKQLSDKDGDLKFVRKWLPELHDMDHEDIKSLWTPAGTFILESNTYQYPHPIVDIIEANRQARIILWSIMRREDTRQESKKVFEKLWSRKKPSKRMSKKKKPDTDQGSLFGELE